MIISKKALFEHALRGLLTSINLVLASSTRITASEQIEVAQLSLLANTLVQYADVLQMGIRLDFLDRTVHAVDFLGYVHSACLAWSTSCQLTMGSVDAAMQVRADDRHVPQALGLLLHGVLGSARRACLEFNPELRAVRCVHDAGHRPAAANTNNILSYIESNHVLFLTSLGRLLLRQYGARIVADTSKVTVYLPRRSLVQRAAVSSM